jgi:hypothetical protein
VNKYIPDDSAQGQWQLRLLETSEIPYANHSHFKKIWQNLLNPNSLRLSKTGWEWLKTCTKVTTYRFTLESPMTNRMLLQLDHRFQSPYFIINRMHIHVVGEQDAIMLQLHGNNLSAYLDSLDLTN